MRSGNRILNIIIVGIILPRRRETQIVANGIINKKIILLRSEFGDLGRTYNVYNKTHREPLNFSDRKHCKRLRRQPFRSVGGRGHRFQTLHRTVHADQEFVRSNNRSDTSKSTIMINNYNVIKYLNVVSYRLQIVCYYVL